MKCEVCGNEFIPKKENKYVAVEKAALFSPSKFYDCFDCPSCGCQIVAKERFDNVMTAYEVTDENE